MIDEQHSPKFRAQRLASSLPFLLTILAGCATVEPRAPAHFGESLAVSTPLPKSIGELRTAFRTRYNEAIAAHMQHLRSTSPVITQDLLNMTLLRPDGPPVRFSMNAGPYMLMAHTAHSPLTLYSILSVQGFGPLSDATRQELAEYEQALQNAIKQIKTIGLPISTQARLASILSDTEKFVAESLRTGVATREQFEAYARPLRKLIEINLRTGASEQLMQFRDQLNAWKAEFPQESWADLRVVVLGVHQARDQYALKLFFQWLLREPGYEDRVVYAEVASPPSGEARAAAEAQALELLTKVDFEHDAGTLIFGDATILQKDVMGPATLEILREWGTPNWP
ncbi:MAG TPA: hypothetical protein VMB48_00715 [Steroidobacteraceae bacterium]|nr:hypothetical protein [Steroidobacteraceae bacterium]